MNIHDDPCFVVPGRYFCALNAVSTSVTVSMMENIILFINTYVKDTKFIPGWQPFFNNFHPPSPNVHVRGTGGFMFFCIYFWKGWRRTWTIQWGVRHTISLHHLLCPVHSTYIPTIFIYWWLSLIIDVPHVDFRSTHVMISLLIIIVDFRLWWVPLLMIFLVVYTFILVDLHWQSTLQFQV